MMNKNKIFQILVSLFLCLMIIGCGSTYRLQDNANSSSYMIPKEDYPQSSKQSGELENEWIIEEEPETYSYSSNTTKTGITAADGIPTDSGLSSDTAQVSEENTAAGMKLVYSGNLIMETLEYDDTLASLRGLVASCGGYTEYEYEGTGSTYWYRAGKDRSFKNRKANFTVRIPSDCFSSFMNGMTGLGVVTSRNIHVENITRSYNDTSATVEALRMEEERLLEMMKLAETVEDMILVEKRLSEVERSLNSYKTKLSGMDLDVAYSAVDITINEVEKITEAEPVSFGTRLADTFFESMEDFSEFCQDLVVNLLYLLPFLLLLILVIWLVVTLIRRRIRRKKAKEEKKA